MERNEADWADCFARMGALWVHDGNPRRPHAELTSDQMHSNGFFNAGVVTEDSTLLDEVAGSLSESLLKEGVFGEMIDWVVGPAMGAITLAHDVARHVSGWMGFPCLSTYAEKEVVDGKKCTVIRRSTIRSGARVLLVEDTLTTGASVGLVANAVVKAGGIVLPYVVTVVNRSGLSVVDGRKVVALVEKHMPKWTPGECPLCKKGSEAIRPKGAENWARLTAKY